MSDLRKKQRRFKLIRNVCVIACALVILIYIGIQPYLASLFASTAIFEFIAFALVLASLALVFLYESKFSKVEEFLNDADLKINDSGYYITAREESDCESYLNAVLKDLTEYGYKSEKEVTLYDFDFAFSAHKKGEYFYAVNVVTADENDIIAYMNSAKSDLTSQKLAVNGDCVVLFVCNKADYSAIKLSKDFERIITGRRSRLLIFPTIVELETKRVYFLGNKLSRAQKMIVNYVMNCELPLKKNTSVMNSSIFKKNTKIRLTK